MKKKQLVLNTPLRGLPAGAVVTIDFENDVVVDPYWRARLADAHHDGCVEIVTIKKHRETKVVTSPETKNETSRQIKPLDKTIEKKG